MKFISAKLDFSSILKRATLVAAAYATLVIAFNHEAFCQWTQGSEIGNTQVSAIANYSGFLAAEGGGSTPDSVWFSSDNGLTWSLRSNNIPILATSFVNSGDTIVVASGNPGGILYSTDLGNSWNQDT